MRSVWRLCLREGGDFVVTHAERAHLLAVLGEDELAQGKCTVKNMRTGQQELLTAQEAAAHIQAALAENNGPVILE